MIKIYAIRDRLIDYFMQPFVGPDDKSVLASVARLVNQGEITSDIAQAPHQFEVWTLGHVTEEGHVVAERAYLGDCSSLIRGDIRRTTRPAPGGEEAERPDQRSRDAIVGPGGPGAAETRPVQAETPPEDRSREKAYQAASRGT